MSSTMASVDSSPSCPPATQAIRAGVCAGSPRRFASAWSSGNRVSSSPAMIRVGALTASSTGSGPDSSSSAISSLLGRPVSAALRYSVHRLGSEPPADRVPGRRAGPSARSAEEQRSPALFEDPRPSGRDNLGQRGRAADHLVLREQRLIQPVPGEGRNKSVHPAVQSRSQQREGTAVGGAREPDHRISVDLDHFGPPGRQVDDLDGVRALELRVVEVDPPAGCAEAASGVDDHRVPSPGQSARGLQTVVLGAAEAVGQHDRRPRGVGVGGQHGHVERDRPLVRLRGAVDGQHGLDHVLAGVLRVRDRRSGSDEAGKAGEQQDPAREQRAQGDKGATHGSHLYQGVSAGTSCVSRLSVDRKISGPCHRGG